MTRSIRVRQRQCRYGNPSLGTFYGHIHTFQEYNATENIQNDNDDEEDKDENDESSYSSIEEGDVIIRDDTSVIDAEESAVCCMVHVPSEQLPEGVLYLARFHRPFIRDVRIVVSLNDAKTSRHDDKKELDCEHGLSYIVLFTMKSAKAASDFVEDLHRKPYSSLEPDIRCRVYRCLTHNNVAVVDKSSKTSPQENSSKNESNMIHTPQRSLHSNLLFHSIGASNPNLLSSRSQTPIPSIASNANDSLPSSTDQDREISNTEVTNCAVCLEKLSETIESSEQTILTTVCNHSFHADCLLRWEDTCPVCRYDHSGSSQSLSSCNKCGSLEKVFICLICGVTSCWKESNETMQSTEQINHALMHYQLTLHAYALEAETQHVWDFVGGGYVHRLLQNDDGKIVETSDPQNTHSEERTLCPGLSNAQEEEILHRKLEGYAGQYQTILKNQLGQQRQYYEDVISSIQQNHCAKEKAIKVTHSQLIGTFKQEKYQLEQRMMSLRRKIDEVSEDTKFQNDLVESLKSNKKTLQQEITGLKRTVIEARVYRLKKIPELEAKVEVLMKQLDQGG